MSISSYDPSLACQRHDTNCRKLETAAQCSSSGVRRTVSVLSRIVGGMVRDGSVSADRFGARCDVRMLACCGALRPAAHVCRAMTCCLRRCTGWYAVKSWTERLRGISHRMTPTRNGTRFESPVRCSEHRRPSREAPGALKTEPRARHASDVFQGMMACMAPFSRRPAPPATGAGRRLPRRAPADASRYGRRQTPPATGAGRSRKR